MGVAVAVGLVMWLAILSVHHPSASGAVTVAARPAASQRVPIPRHAPTASAVMGSSCFVDGRECSEVPCTELIGASAPVATVATTVTKTAPTRRTITIPRVKLAQPLSGCGRRRPPASSTVVNRRGPAYVLASPYTALLANMRHRLAAHPPK